MVDAPDWLVEFLDGISLWDALAIGLVFIAVVTFIWKRGWRSVTAMARGVINAAQILEAVQGLPKYITDSKAQYARLEKKVDDIHHETHKNDGSSVKDAVDRTEKSVAGLHGRMDAVEQTLTSLADADTRAHQEFAEHVEWAQGQIDRIGELEDTVDPRKKD